MDLAQRLVPDDVELGFLFFEPVELAEGGVNVCPFRQQHLIAQHRFEDRQVAVPFGPKALAGAGLGQAGDGADLPRPDALGQRVLCPRIQPQLVCLFGPRLTVRFAGELSLDLQFPAGDPEPCQPSSLLILRDLEHLCAEGFQRRSRAGEAVQPFQKFVHALQPEGRTEPAGKDMPPGDGGDDVRIGQGAPVKDGLHQPLVAEGQRLVAGGFLGPEVHKAVAKAAVELFQQGFFSGAGQIHLIHENKGRDAVAPQQPPERFGVALDAVGAADDQHRVIEHLERPLGLGGKIHMAGGVQQGEVGVPCAQQGLFGEDGDAAGLFQRVGVQKGVLVVHAAQLSDGTGAVEHGFGEGGLAGVHMGEDAHHQLFPIRFHGAPPYKKLTQRAMRISGRPSTRLESILQ